jgi:chromosome segregation ATPase
MARPGVTYEEIDQIATDLERQTLKATQARVMQALGRGSATTVNKYLRERQQQRIALADGGAAISTAGEVGEAVSAVWAQLTTDMQQQFMQLKAASEEKIHDLQLANQQLEAEKHTLSCSLKKAQQTLHHLETDVKLARQELKAAHHQCAVLKERAENKEDLANRLQTETQAHIEHVKAAHTEHLASLHQQWADIKQLFAKDITQYRDLLENQRTAFMVKMDAVTQAKDQAEKQALAAETELKQQRALNEERAERIRRLSAELRIAEVSLNSAA